MTKDKTRQDKTRQDKNPDSKIISQVVFLGSLTGANHCGNFAGAVFDKYFCSPTLNTMQGGGRQPHIIIKGEQSW